MTIKSTVSQDLGAGPADAEPSPQALEEMKEDIIAECKDVLMEWLRQERER